MKSSELFVLNYTVITVTIEVACVASVSSRGSSRKLGQEQKKNQPFFCFRSTFRAITRLETLATQATIEALRLYHEVLLINDI